MYSANTYWVGLSGLGVDDMNLAFVDIKNAGATTARTWWVLRHWVSCTPYGMTGASTRLRTLKKGFLTIRAGLMVSLPSITAPQVLRTLVSLGRRRKYSRLTPNCRQGRCSGQSKRDTTYRRFVSRHLDLCCTHIDSSGYIKDQQLV